MADGPLNIEVLADPATCRASGSGVDDLAKGVGGLGSAFGGTGGSSESFWQGGAGPAFREKMNNAKGNADQVERAAAGAARALKTFADEIDTVKARMAQAKQVASGAGLTVSDTEIQPPGPAPAAPPQGPVAPQDQAAHDQASAEHQRQVTAFNEAAATVNDARGKERSAHENLKRAASDNSSTLDTLKTTGETVLSKSIALVGGLSGASHKLLQSAEKSQALGTWATAMLVDPSKLSAEQKTALQQLQRTGYAEAAKAGFQKTQIDSMIGKLPGKLRTTLRYNASDLAKSALSLDKDIPDGFQKGIPVLKRLPLVGTAVTGLTTWGDIASGADPAKSVEKAVGGTAAGMAVSSGLEAGVGAAAAAGMAVPGPGWVVAGGIVGGFAAAEGVNYVVDHYGDQINHAAGEVGHAVGDAGKSVGKFVGNLF
jgi:uncharacterized protein YukE